MAKERRTERRRLARIPLVYAGGNHGHTATFRANSETIDISRGGLRFAIYHQVSECDLLDLEIYISKGTQPLEMVAEVRWKRSFNGHEHQEVGVRFLKIEPSHAYQSYLARLLPEGGQAAKPGS